MPKRKLYYSQRDANTFRMSWFSYLPAAMQICYEFTMPSRRIIAADKSMLAANMYRLLFAPLECTVARALALDDLLVQIKNLRGADLIVINSNVLGGKAERLVAMMQVDERLAHTPKVVLVSEAEIEKGLGSALGAISQSECVVKPFHPDEFMTRSREILGA